MEIKFATKKDAQSLLNIYSQYIDTPITFEYVVHLHHDFFLFI